ncbi:MAG: phosphoribosylformylglycinamidine cyclo-ligase [Phycisphaerae bacterium]
MARKKLTYRDAGVNLDANEAMVERIRAAIRGTYSPRVIDAHGGFAGLFRLDYDDRLFAHNYRKPVLVAATDGVGSKLLVAIQAKRLRTIGIDLVAMCVNDVLTCGAEPLLFLDYIAVHRLDPARAAELVEGVADGCHQAGCALLGGETAEMPDLYAPSHFDLAGFALGVVERHRLIAGPKRVQPGDVMLGLASNGLHANGYALARKLVFEVRGHKLTDLLPELGGTVADVLLRPTRIYTASVLHVLRRYKRKRIVSGMAHITGGGLPGNLPRILPGDCDAVIRRGAWDAPPVFTYLQSLGVERDEMFRVFNMGIGFVMIVRPDFSRSVAAQLRRRGERVDVIGRIRRGGGTVRWQ